MERILENSTKSSAEKVDPVYEDSENGQGLSKDQIDLAYFGKKQKLKRDFGFISITGLTCTMMLTWEGSLIGIGPSLSNGGPTGIFAAFIVAWAGTTLQTLVMAEMASMVPLSGGQYNWVAVLAPKRASSFLSYIVGWMTMLAWLAGGAAVFFITAVVVSTMASLQHATYVPERYQYTLIAYAFIFAAIVVNIGGARLLPKIEAVVLLLHIVSFFVIVIVLAYLSPKNPPSAVFDHFINGGGWDSNGVSFLIGLVAQGNAFLGIDGASHLAEEIQNASAVIPRAMLSSVAINGATGLGMLVLILFCMGSAEQILKSDGSPYVNAFMTATGSANGAVGLAAVPLIIIVFGAIGYIATSSRMTWAFAREKGVPGHQYIARVEPKRALPIWAIFFSVAVITILLLINVGSDVAFNAFLNLEVMGFYTVFLIAALVMLHKRLTTPPEQLRWGTFRLGRLGVPITVLSLVYTLVVLFFAFWPPLQDVTKETMNWGTVVYVSVWIIAGLYWAVYARNHYKGPLIECESTRQWILQTELAKSS